MLGADPAYLSDMRYAAPVLLVVLAAGCRRQPEPRAADVPAPAPVSLAGGGGGAGATPREPVISHDAAVVVTPDAAVVKLPQLVPAAPPPPSEPPSPSSEPPPLQQVTVGRVSMLHTPGGPSDWEVRGALQRQLDPVIDCYRAALFDVPFLDGELVVELEVEPSGQVTAARLSGMPHRKLKACVADALVLAVLPAMPAATAVRTRLTLKP